MKISATVRSWAVILILSVTVAATFLNGSRETRIHKPSLESVPMEIDGYLSETDPPIAQSIVAKLKPTSYIARTYRKPGSYIHLFVVYYAQQRAGEAMHSPDNCLPGGGWEIIRRGTRALTVGSRKAMVNDYDVLKNGKQLRVLYWYQTPNRIIGNQYSGKVLLLWDAIRSGDSQGSLVTLMCQKDSVPQSAIVNFGEQVMQSLHQSLNPAQSNFALFISH